VVSTGSVTYESRRKVVQHFEGGIVQDVLVKEGQNVVEGQVLFRLEDTQPRANLELVLNSLDSLLSQEARLIAERDEADAIVFPDEVLARKSSQVVQKVMQDQIAQFRERRSSITGQIGILEGRVQQYQSEINGLKLELLSAEKQLAFIEDELVGVRDLADKGLVPKSRWLALEREAARLQGIVGRNEAESSKAQNSMSEMRLQIQQTKQKLREEVSALLQDARQKMNDARERKRVAEDVLRRVDILSPQAGRLQNVKLSTKGAVIRSGDVVAEVVPVADEMIVEAQVSPTDVDKLQEGSEAEVRFVNFNSRTTPVILGKVSTISRDRLIDEGTRQPYFLAQIAIRDTNIPERLKETLSAGMQVEIIIPTGERTVLQYLVQPLGDAFAKTFRER
jgi:HlyD family type I secretion membrane fusion protein